jgi:hypothetical protein
MTQVPRGAIWGEGIQDGMHYPVRGERGTAGDGRSGTARLKVAGKGEKRGNPGVAATARMHNENALPHSEGRVKRQTVIGGHPVLTIAVDGRMIGSERDPAVSCNTDGTKPSKHEQ